MRLQTAKGTRDLPFKEKILKNQIVATLQEVFELYGFSPLETPILEKYETLAAKFAAGSGSDIMKEIFKLTDQGKRKLGLRFDLTVPMCRFIAMNPTLKMPFKRYQIGRVFRDGPIKLGRYREFWQADVDIVGSSSMLADAEVLSVVKTVFNKLKLDIIIKVNNRKLLNGILEQVDIKKKEPAIIALDKLEKIGVGGVTKELLQRGYNKSEIKKLFELINEKITFSQLKNKIKNEEGQEGIEELEELFSYLKVMGVKATFDVSLARGLAYYTGTVFEVFTKKEKVTSSITAGGRYNQMIGDFMGGGRIVPAMGISFGLAPIIDVLNDKTNFIKKTPTLVFVIPIKTIKQALKIVQQLRGAGIKTGFDLNRKGISKNLQYAGTLGIPYVLIIGERELKKKKVLLRDMQTGKERLMTINQVIKSLK